MSLQSHAALCAEIAANRQAMRAARSDLDDVIQQLREAVRLEDEIGPARVALFLSWLEQADGRLSETLDDEEV